jgi:putative endonuclease
LRAQSKDLGGPNHFALMRDLFVYVMTNQLRTTIYVGVTNDLVRRVSEHQNGEFKGFTRQYRLTILVYHETYPDARSAIAREKQLKGWRRTKKDALISSMNPEWRDLSVDLFPAPLDRRGPSTAPAKPGSAQDDTGGAG